MTSERGKKEVQGRVVVVDEENRKVFLDEGLIVNLGSTVLLTLVKQKRLGELKVYRRRERHAHVDDAEHGSRAPPSRLCNDGTFRNSYWLV